MHEKDFFRGKINYIIEETSAYLISILVSGAYLAKLTSTIGFSDSLTAILSSFVALGCSFQLLAIFLFKDGKTKKRTSWIYLINQLLFACLYVIPLIKLNHMAKTVIFISFMLGGYFLQNIAFSPKTTWFMSFVPDSSRGRFTAIKEGISLVCGMGFSFLMSSVIDYYEKIGQIRASFIVCAITIFVLAVIHSCSLIFTKEVREEKKTEKSAVKNLRNVFRDKNARFVIGLSLIWAVTNNVAIPFYGTYEIKELNFTMTYVSLLAIIGAAARIISSVFLGKYADKRSFTQMLKICYGMLALSFLSVVFATPKNGYIMFFFYRTLHGAAFGGINSAETNLVYDYITPEKRKDTLAIKQTLYGLCGFLTTIIASPFLKFVQKSGNTVFGVTVYAQQILSAVSLIFVTILVIYIDRKSKVIKN